MAFAGTIAALILAMPAIAEAQQARMTTAGLSVVRDDGLTGVTADVRPTGGGVLQIFGVDGQTQRIQLGASGLAGCAPGDTSATCQGGNAGLDVRYANGDLAARIGLLAPALVPVIRLVDEQGNDRYRASLDLDGNPTLQFFDAAGNVVWAAP